MRQLEQPRPLTIGILGYNTDLSFKGLHNLAYDNEEQVVRHKKEYLRLADGTKIVPIPYSNSSRLYGLQLDQLIIFDDDRWLIETRVKSCEMIQWILRNCFYTSCVPDEYQIIKYEDL